MKQYRLAALVLLVLSAGCADERVDDQVDDQVDKLPVLELTGMVEQVDQTANSEESKTPATAPVLICPAEELPVRPAAGSNQPQNRPPAAGSIGHHGR
jgi:hypothetical protein